MSIFAKTMLALGLWLNASNVANALFPAIPMLHNPYCLILPVTLVELSSYSLYIHIIYLPVGGHCARAGARAPMWKR